MTLNMEPAATAPEPTMIERLEVLGFMGGMVAARTANVCETTATIAKRPRDERCRPFGVG
jgi:hypothetical protein